MRPGPVVTGFLAVLLSLPLPCRAEPLAVSGRVVDAHGRAVAGARIELAPVAALLEERRVALAGRAQPDPVATVASDASGGFSITAPGPGMWTLTIRAKGFVPGHRSFMPLLEPEDLPAVRLQLDDQGTSMPGARVTSEVTPRAVTDTTGKPSPELSVGR
ncbi:MAG TPA: carboxypeptidase-like regulatory domain-containing protein, partial [Thermoanaerobaculia bacterium]|nr:carboxypeptidase-like regulatory domain-containing protein [Thermoanaerobaculia bacterium]